MAFYRLSFYTLNQMCIAVFSYDGSVFWDLPLLMEQLYSNCTGITYVLSIAVKSCAHDCVWGITTEHGGICFLCTINIFHVYLHSDQTAHQEHLAMEFSLMKRSRGTVFGSQIYSRPILQSCLRASFFHWHICTPCCDLANLF